MYRYTKIALAATVLTASGIVAFAANTTGNDATKFGPATISMSQAVTAAEQFTNGRATHAELEKTKGVLAYDVEVVNGAKVFDVKIDPEKGTVISSVEDQGDRDDENDNED